MKTKIKNIKAGTVIHTEKPFVHILNCKLRSERCDQCFDNKHVLKCSGCQYVHYCGRACQKESWPIHRSECKNLRMIAPRVVPDAARLLGRLIIKLKTGGDMEKGYYTTSAFRKFKDLMSHYTDIKEDQKRMEHFTSLCGVLFEYLGESLMPNSAELLGMYGRMCVNGFNILDSEMTSLGTGIYLGASVVDHSCKPNALAVFEGTKIFIRTLSPLPSLDWSQVFISYIDLLDTPTDRQSELQTSYYFLCQCSICLDITQISDMHSAICPNAKCDATINMSNIVENGDNNCCAKCEEAISNTFISNYQQAIEFTRLQLQDMRNMAYLDICKMCLKKQNNLLHSLNILHVKTLDLAFESSIQMGFWDEAEDYGILLIPGFKRYYGNIHPLMGLLYMKMGKILLYKNKTTTSLEYLKEAGNVLAITHGKSHPLYKNTLYPLLQQATMESAVV